MKNKIFNSIMFLLLVALLINNTYALSLRNLAQSYLQIKKSLPSLMENAKNGVSALFITGKSGQSSVINFRLKNTGVLFSLGLLDKEFVLKSRNYKYLSIQENKLVTLKGEQIITNALKLKGEIKYFDIPQWRMILEDTFSKNNTSLDWSIDGTTQCGLFQMLGGYCQISSQNLTKEITIEQNHTMIRIEASYHFLGKWDSQTGYLKLDTDSDYLWTYRCKTPSNTTNLTNMCDKISVCKLGVPINVSIKHSANKLKLIFGSTLDENSCEKSYAISDVRIYIR